MSNSKLKQIKDVVRNFDARDPRGAMEAIEHILKAESLATKEPKPAFVVKVFDIKDVGIKVELKHVDGIDPGVVMAAKETINQFGQDTFGSAIKNADTGELIGFEKFGEYKGVTQISGPDCDCPACRLKALLKEIRAKIEAKDAEGSQDDLPAGAVFQTEVDGAKATAFTSVDDLMAYVQGKADTNATDSGTTQGAN